MAYVPKASAQIRDLCRAMKAQQHAVDHSVIETKNMIAASRATIERTQHAIYRINRSLTDDRPLRRTKGVGRKPPTG